MRVWVREFCDYCFSTVLAGDGSGRTERKEKVYGQLFWFSGRQGLWVSRGCLLELGAKIKQLSERREVRRSWTVRSTGDGTREKQQLVFYCSPVDKGWERIDSAIHRLLNDSVKSKRRCYF